MAGLSNLINFAALMNQYGKVAFYTLGCKLNFSETSTLARSFEEAGYAKVSFDEPADVYVINTCSVTDNADKKCRYYVKRAQKNNPAAKIIVVGCYAQLKPDEIAAIPGVNMVLGANEKFNVVKHLELWSEESHKVFNEPIKETKTFYPAWSSGDRTRTFLKVQDGCNYFCAFCTIPLARGVSRSANIAQTIEEAQKVALTGAKEVVLTGVNIGDFGHGTDENLLGLITELDKIEGIERFRISSIEPNLLSDDIIRFVAASKKFVPHFHVPLQSGSDQILESMRRRYKSELYSDRVAHIKKLMPNACIGVDVIVGFPGETDELFDETYRFLNELDVSYLHVFTYSERPNTTAIRMSDVVPADVREKRSKMLRILSTKKKRKFYQDHVGATFTVLFEAEREGDSMFGFTENYLKVEVPFDEALVNKLAQVELLGINSEGNMLAKVLQKESVKSIQL
jgi:threonylcarbamoyladenosine tRNA methylthiotransferase MtaB